MHEAKTRLSKLVKQVEEENEIVVLCRNGHPVAEIRPAAEKRANRLKHDPKLRVRFAKGFNPMEPLREDEVPDEYR